MSESILTKLQGMWKSIVTVPDVKDEDVPPEDDPVGEMIDRNKGKTLAARGKEKAAGPAPVEAAAAAKPTPEPKGPPAVIILPPVEEKKVQENPKPELPKEVPAAAQPASNAAVTDAPAKNNEIKAGDMLDIFTSEELKKGEAVISDGLEDIDIFALLREAEEIAARLKERKE